MGVAPALGPLRPRAVEFREHRQCGVPRDHPAALNRGTVEAHGSVYRAARRSRNAHGRSFRARPVRYRLDHHPGYHGSVIATHALLQSSGANRQTIGTPNRARPAGGVLEFRSPNWLLTYNSTKVTVAKLMHSLAGSTLVLASSIYRSRRCLSDSSVNRASRPPFGDSSLLFTNCLHANGGSCG